MTDIPLAHGLVIGRDPACGAVLDDPGVSRKQASIERTRAGWVLADLGGGTGCFVNGQRFDRHDLIVGDRIQIGPYHFRFDGTALVRAAELPGATIEATDIALDVGPVPVLREITASIEPGTFAAILGPSGAGKSSFLHILTGLVAPSSGSVAIRPPPGEPLVVGFVPQDDIVHPELTVAEALSFAAELRLPPRLDPAERHKAVVGTLARLGLRERASTRVSSLSGGQRKRVSVGVEILARPSVLFLDEPTSGLDPATEFKLMELLRDLADTGCTVVCTTHVMEHVYLVDRLLVLAAGKLEAAGAPDEIRAHFGITSFSSLYDKLPPGGAARFGPRKRPRTSAHKHPAAAAAIRRHAFGVLLRRQWAILRSDPRNFVLLAGQPTLIAALVSWVVEAPSLVLFFAYVATLWFAASNAAQEIVREIAVFRRERLIGVSRSAYIASKAAFLGLITLAQAAILLALLGLFERGIPGDPTLLAASLAGIALSGTALGLAISAFARTAMQAVLFVPLALIPLILFSGHPVPAHEMAPAVRAVARATPSHASQQLSDAAFLWNKKLAREAISDHWTAFRNLNTGNRYKTGDTFRDPSPAISAALVHAAWIVGGLALTAAALARRERAL